MLGIMVVCFFWTGSEGHLVKPISFMCCWVKVK